MCYRPIYISHSNIYRSIADTSTYQTVPCGTCLECRIQRSQDWIVRCTKEASKFHSEHNLFVTLTYSNDNLPQTLEGEITLNYRDVQLFHKRLRKYLNKSFTFLGCSEYSPTGRPHYHFNYFNMQLPTNTFLAPQHFQRKGANPTYFNDLLTNCWKKGHVLIGYATPETYAYVTRYTLKKSLFPQNFEKHDDDIEINYQKLYKENEKMYCSRKYAIGLNFSDEELKTNKIYMSKGKIYPIPKAYWRKRKQEIIEQGFLEIGITEKENQIVNKIRVKIFEEFPKFNVKLSQNKRESFKKQNGFNEHDYVLAREHSLSNLKRTFNKIQTLDNYSAIDYC